MGVGGSGAEAHLVRTVDAVEHGICFGGLEPGKPYTFDVRAANRVGTGPASKRSRLLCCGPQLPSPPMLLKVLGVNNRTQAVVKANALGLTSRVSSEGTTAI